MPGKDVNGGKAPSRPRCVALVGPYLSGKTTLLESLLFATGAITRKGRVQDGNTISDTAPEARARQMSIELSAAGTEYLGDPWTFLDCPGSIEFGQDCINALMVADTAVIVCEPIIDKALALAPLFRMLDERGIPHMVFVNRMDTANVRVRDLLDALQSVSARPLVLRQVPIRDGESLSGYVDLVSERAYQYRPGQASDLIPLPQSIQDQEKSARQELLEALADFDDGLLEQLLEDTVPSKEEIYSHLTQDLQSDLIVPVFLGVAEQDHGVRRLLKALRHEVPEPEVTARRLGIDPDAGEPLAEVFKTYHAPHTGKLSLVRVWRGRITDGMTLNGARVSGVSRMLGQTQAKLQGAEPGEVVALGRMDPVLTGDCLTPSGNRPDGIRPWPERLPPLFALAINAEKRSDEVKLTGALAKLIEEDPSISYEQNPETQELVLWGQGEMHLLVALDRLRSKYNLPVNARPPQTPYRETIRRKVDQHARFKRQTGGHGQFGDVRLTIEPQPRGAGFAFKDTIVGGVVPKQYIPSVEAGVREYMQRGPLGFPVVDIAVTLTDGTYHTVDSSDQAFKTAAQMAMREGMPKCDPVLLEPVFDVVISIPSEHTSKVQRMVSGRRGQILGFNAKEDWPGWDEVHVHLPQAEMHDLIVELRSLTLGVGTYSYKFDHLQELSGKLAERVVETRQTAAAS